MKEVIGHIYSNTKEQLKEITDKLTDFEIAYDNEQRTNVTVIKEVEDEQAD